MSEEKKSKERLWLALLFTALVLIIILHFFKACTPDIPTGESSREKDSLKHIIAYQKRVADSLKTVANGHDSVRLEYITQWRTKIKTIIQHDSIPCDSILPMVVSTCDSIISKDSIYIKDLRDIIYTDSIIMDGQAQVMVLDSIKIAKLERDVAKLKKHRKWLFGSTAVLTTILILSKR
jgi:hypothetical protein